MLKQYRLLYLFDVTPPTLIGSLGFEFNESTFFWLIGQRIERNTTDKQWQWASDDTA